MGWCSSIQDVCELLLGPGEKEVLFWVVVGFFFLIEELLRDAEEEHVLEGEGDEVLFDFEGAYF